MTSMIPPIHRPRAWCMVVLAAATLGGCAAPLIDGPLDVDGAGDETTPDARLSHGYALLLGLLDDEARVDGILAIKSPRKGVADLLRHIAMQARVERDHLRPLLEAAPRVTETNGAGLPLIERDVRRRIENEETPALLLAGGKAFETRILLTQQKAAQYAAALCASLSKADPNEERSKLLEIMTHHWMDLEQETRAWLSVIEGEPPASAMPDYSA